MASPATVVDLLRHWAGVRPNATAFTFLPDGDDAPTRLTFHELDVRARAIASHLQGQRAAGERALLLYPNGLDFVAAYLGCLYAAVVPVPAPQPTRPFSRTLSRIRGIVASSGTRFAIASSSTVALAKSAFGAAPELERLEWLANDSVPDGLADQWEVPAIDADTLGLVQYTSGSTSMPRGVLVSQGNLLQSCSMMDRAWNHTETSVVVSWLPTFHDMGLVYGMLTPLFKGFHCVMMTPASFVRRPRRWLEAFTRFGGTHSFAPNFGYDLCVRKIPREERVGLDLSAWRVAGSGAEQIRKETIESFYEAFAPFGLRRSAMVTAYGLAESTLAVTGSSATSFPTIIDVSRSDLDEGRVVIGEAAGAPSQVRACVSVGAPLAETAIGIIDPERRTRCAPDAVGEVWIGGATVAKGYLDLPEETEQTFRARIVDTGEGPFLRTGDLGFMHAGELFICGRLKDLIIVRGRNHHPEDIEATVERTHPGVRRSSSAAISSRVDDHEELVIVAELERRVALDEHETIAGSIRREAALHHDVEPAEVVFVVRGTLPKTSSGKVQRAACRAAYRAGSLDVVTVWRGSAATSSSASEGIVETLRAEVARLAGCPIDKIPADVIIHRVGLDSVKLVELSAFVERRFGVFVSAERLVDDASLRDLASLAVAAPSATLRPVCGNARKPAMRSSTPARVAADSAPSEGIEFSLFFFAVDSRDAEPYRLLLEATKECDRSGFHAAWIPERHFHPFGGVFPNPAVAAGALATLTTQIRLRAGSVVLPLHDPLRVAEEWSLVDNLSNGRVDLAFASGWAANDFVLMPKNFPERRRVNLQGIETVKRLWAGEPLTLPNGVGELFEARIYPRPVQPTLATWLTCTGAIDGFVEAGAAGHNVLTALLFQSVDELAAKISVYRSARAANGHDPDKGRVTLMLHTFLGESVEEVREIVRDPFKSYLRSSISLWRDDLVYLKALGADDEPRAVDAAFERYFSRNALFGTPDTCLENTARLRAIGVDEIACLIDFGVETDRILRSLTALDELRRRTRALGARTPQVR